MRLGSEFRRIWTGNAASNLADGVTFIALPLLAATLTSDPAAIAGLTVAYTIPRVLSVLGIGVLIDRADRRRLLYAANFSRAAVFAVLTALVMTDTVTLLVLYAVFVLMGVIETLSDNTAFAVLPQAVPRNGLDQANSRITSTQLVLDEFLGPPLGGFLFAFAAFAPSAVNTVAFLVAGLSYLLLRGTYRSPASSGGSTRGADSAGSADLAGPGGLAGQTGPRSGIVADIREGAAWLRGSAVVRANVAIGTLACVAYMIPFSYLVLYADQVLGLDPSGYGTLLALTALGGLAGAGLAGRLRAWIGYGWSIVLALAVGSASFLAIAASENLVVVAVALSTYIGHAALWNVLAASLRQKAVPRELMGRVLSIGRLLSYLGLASGAALGGWLASALGLRLPFLLAGLVFAVATGVALLTLPALRTWERSEREREREREAVNEQPGMAS